MLFFVIIGAIAALAGLAQWLLGLPVQLPLAMRTGLAAALILAGTDHLLNPQRYLAMMPRRIPFPLPIVYGTGLCEIAGAVGLMVPMLREAAGLALALYFVCVFPANIRNALEGLAIDGLPRARWYYWVRLPFQPLVIWWALMAAELLPLPFARG